MTNEQLIELRGLIFESELAAEVYGRQSQRLAMITEEYPNFKEKSEKIEKEYHDKWGIKSKALHDFIETL